MNSRGKEAAGLCIGTAGAFGAVWLLTMVIIPLIIPQKMLLRMFLLFIAYWLIAAVPLIVMRVQKDRFGDYGFTKEKLPQQIITGIVLGTVFAVILVLPPYSLGFGALWDNGYRFGRDVWKYGYQLIYDTAAIAAVEELVFRGFCMKKIERMTGNAWVGAAVSSIVFGLFHFSTGSIVQILMTTAIGAGWAVCKLKIRHCTLLSLIIAHGLYDFIIAAAASLTHL